MDSHLVTLFGTKGGSKISDDIQQNKRIDRFFPVIGTTKTIISQMKRERDRLHWHVKKFDSNSTSISIYYNLYFKKVQYWGWGVCWGWDQSIFGYFRLRSNIMDYDFRYSTIVGTKTQKTKIISIPAPAYSTASILNLFKLEIVINQNRCWDLEKNLNLETRGVSRAGTLEWIHHRLWKNVTKSWFKVFLFHEILF